MTKKFIVLFAILNFFLACFYLDTWQNGNTTSRAIAVLAFAESHTLQIDKRQEESVDKSFINGHYYSDKAPLPLFLVIPFYELVNLFGINPANSEKTAYIIGDILCGSVPFTLIVLVSFLSIRKKNNSAMSPVLCSMLPFYASFIFIYSGTFYAHLLSAFFLLMAYICLRGQKKYFLAGILCGLSFLSEFPTALVLIIWGAQIYFRQKSISPVLKFSAGILPSLLFIAVYNYCLTGNMLTSSYKYHAMQDIHSNYGFSLPTLHALWGLSFSPYRGIIFYTPFLLLYFYEELKPILSISFRQWVSVFFTNYLAIISISSLVFISGYFEWWGGWCYGPRLIFFIAVLLCFEGIVFISSGNFYKPMFWILILLGFACTFMAKSTVVYSVPTEINNPITEQVIPNFTNNNFNPNNILTMIFDLQPKTANYIWLASFIIIAAGLTLLYKKEITGNAKQTIK
ncbi:MAG: hypothetical protein ACHQHP_01115 [Bacteroidia bacterium]